MFGQWLTTESQENMCTLYDGTLTVELEREYDTDTWDIVVYYGEIRLADTTASGDSKTVYEAAKRFAEQHRGSHILTLYQNYPDL